VVEHLLPKQRVAGSSPVSRFSRCGANPYLWWPWFSFGTGVGVGVGVGVADGVGVAVGVGVELPSELALRSSLTRRAT
jgi:hypothetical protein